MIWRKAPLGERFWSDVWGFGREILIVLIGVALGLWAQQLASDAGWSDTVATTRKTLTSELEGDLVNAYRISLLRPCSMRFENGASRFLLEPAAMAGRRLPGRAGVQVVVFSDAAWRAALASQVTSHMEPEQVSSYADVYDYVRTLAAVQEKVVETLPLIRLIGDGRRVTDPRIIEDRLKALSQFKSFVRTEALRADHLIEAIEDDLHLKVDAEELAGLRTSAKECEAQALTALGPETPPEEGERR